MYISTPPSSEVENFQMKIYISTPPSPKVENLWPRRGSNPEPAEPEAYMLPSEPTWHASKNKYLFLHIQKYEKKKNSFYYLGFAMLFQPADDAAWQLCEVSDRNVAEWYKQLIHHSLELKQTQPRS